MHCDGCAKKVRRTLEAVPGVESALVAHETNSAVIESTRVFPASELESALRTVGSYAVREGKPTIVEKKVPTILEKVRPFAPLIALLMLVLFFATAANALFGHHGYHDWMRFCMAGFFIIFGLPKVVNLPQFAAMFRGYDIVAQRFPAWGYVYPFVELELGILYLFDLYPSVANIATFAVMMVGTIGIVQKLRSGATQTCACLGGFFSVPLTWLTVGENMAMALMAVWMQLFH